MRLGTQTGSLINHVLANAGPAPAVGMAATLLSWTDRHPATVIEVTKKYIVVQEDQWERIDRNAISEVQRYEYFRNENGNTYIFKRGKDGDWSEARWNPDTERLNKVDGYGLMLGRRERYYDVSF